MNFALGVHEEAVVRRMQVLANDVPRIWERSADFWGGNASRHASVASRLGWLDVMQIMQRQAHEMEAFARGVRETGFTDAVVLGMGGSSLAPEVIARSIGDKHGGPVRLHVLDTTDPGTIIALTNRVNLKTTLFFVSSKSGTTIEALSLFAYFHELVAELAGSDAGSQFVAITDDGTPLQRLAAEKSFRRTFVNPSDIGGRYSALSYFGLVPASVAGVDVRELLRRGQAAADDARASDSEAVRLGAALGELALAGRRACTFLISPQVATFGLWIEQLIAESTGKSGTGILPVVDEPAVPPAAYGKDRYFVYLRLDGDDNSELDARVADLRKESLPVITIELQDVYDLGSEFFRWMFAVAIAGQVLGINPFDEPNVQESKDNTAQMLEEFGKSGNIPLDSVSPEEALRNDALRSLLDDVEAGGYAAIMAYTPASADIVVALQDLRLGVAGTRRIPTTLGFGPRFLHSTGQLHKGGPAGGRFLQILGNLSEVGDSRAEDVPIPGRTFTFGQLKRAQAVGDRLALLRHGYHVLSIELTDGYAGLEALSNALKR